MTIQPALLSATTLAQYLGVDRSTVYRLGLTREIPAIRMGGIVRFRREDVDTWISRHRAATRADEGRLRARRRP